ncbi:MAG TPA: hypothetical protein VMS99_18225, partial [Acidimicrobiia bacterium]|nr:hypothetical protein [Acidimicrobiia bacterium]
MKRHLGRRLALVGLAVTTAVTGVLPGAMTAQADTVAELVQVVDPSLWSPIAPGPAGVAYRPDENSLIVVDSDRNNLSGFDGINLWEYSLTTGLVLYTGVLPTIEPTGVDYDPDNNRLFVSSDSDDLVLVIGPGADGKFGTGDDVDLGQVALVGDIEDPVFHP